MYMYEEYQVPFNEPGFDFINNLSHFVFQDF